MTGWDEDRKDQVLSEIVGEPGRGDFRAVPGIEGLAIEHTCTHCSYWVKMIVFWRELVAARGGQPVIDSGTGQPCVWSEPNGAIVVVLACGSCGSRNDKATFSPWDIDQVLNVARSRGLV
jgi:hypothetical protein